MGGGSSSWSPSGWADLVFIERGPGGIQCLNFVIQFAKSIVDRLHDLLGCSHAPDATHARGGPRLRARALRVAALRRDGTRSTGTPGSAGKSRCSSISTTRPIPPRCALSICRLGRRGRSAPISGVPVLSSVCVWWVVRLSLSLSLRARESHPVRRRRRAKLTDAGLTR